MKALITQSNYIPWKGYFDNIAMSDVFVVYDDMQYTRRDWRNRNYIKTESGLKWLTIPVEVKGKYLQKINETKVAEGDWNLQHWQQLEQAYRKAPFFKEMSPWIKELYLTANQPYLTEINVHFLQSICQFLGINTRFEDSRSYILAEGKTERLVNICKELNADTYLTGPAAKNYMDESLFAGENIDIVYFDYSGYPEYEQLHPPFEHGVTVLDLIFNKGADAKNYLKLHR